MMQYQLFHHRPLPTQMDISEKLQSSSEQLSLLQSGALLAQDFGCLTEKIHDISLGILL